MRTIVRGACPLDCPDTCSWHVDVEDGRAVGLRGDRAHPFTRGALCGKVNRYLDALHGADRLLHPLRRVGPRARALRAHRLGRGARRGRGRHPRGDRAPRPRVRPALLLRRHDGHGPGLDDGPAAVRGARRLAPPDDDLHRGRRRRPRGHPRRLGRHGPGGLRARAARDPVGREPALDERPPVALRARRAAARRARGRDRPAAHGHRRALRRAPRAAARAPTPRSRSGSCAPSSTRAPRTASGSPRHTDGWPELEARLAEWPVERAAAICGLPAERVRALGARLAHTRPTAIRVGLGLQRHGGAGAAMRAILAMPARHRRLAARRRRRAVHDGRATSRLRRGRVAVPADLPAPPARTINMSRLGEALTELDDPPVAALVVFDANPAASDPDQRARARGPGARGPVHGRAGAAPDRHGALRRHRPAGDDAARAPRPARRLRAPLRHLEPARRRRRRASACRTRRSSAAWPARSASTTRACATRTRRWRATCSTATRRAPPGSRSSGCATRARCA